MDLLTFLELTPEGGEPYNKLNPAAETKVCYFCGGAGMVTYLIIEHDRRVIILSVMWVG